MDTLRVLIVEDDDADAADLRALLDRYAAERGLSLMVRREPGAFSLGELAPSFDLILLDIELPGIDGMEAAEALRDQGVRTPLIFVTNLAQYAVHGYAVDALDFVVKPVTWGSASMALDRALRAARREQGATLAVRTRDEVVVMAQRDVAHIEVRGHDLMFFETGREEPVVGHGTLSAVERELGDEAFVRISSSCLVGLAHIRRVRRDSVVMDTGAELFFSRRRKRAALEAITEYLGGTR